MDQKWQEVRESAQMIEKLKRDLVDVSSGMRNGLGLKPGDRAYDHVEMAIAGLLARLAIVYGQLQLELPVETNEDDSIPF